ncbi:MAG TPA: NAD-dependent epimerase/dehydratase family protein [Terriglobia bacterium]|jgi:nucleoside-diphosphate-sugar epimerase
MPKRPTDFYQGRRVLVTGGMGFIGSNLTMALVQQGAEVTVVDAQVPGCGWHADNLTEVVDKIQLCRLDIGDQDRMRPLIGGQQVVFNLAGEISHVNSMAHPQRDLDINCAAQLRFLDLCRRENPQATIVYASSRQVYGRPKYLPVDEEHSVHPVDYNGVHKRATEEYHFLLRQQFGMRTVSLRLGNVYGPRQGIHQDCRGFIDTFARTALEGRQIVVFGSGKQLRGMTCVDDTVDAFLRAGTAGPLAAPVYNVGHPEPISLWRVAETVSRIAGSPPPRLAPFPPERRAIDVGDIFQNPDKFCREFGWVARVGLEEGLRKTIQFFRANAKQRLDAIAHSLH